MLKRSARRPDASEFRVETNSKPHNLRGSRLIGLEISLKKEVVTTTSYVKAKFTRLEVTLKMEVVTTGAEAGTIDRGWK